MHGSSSPAPRLTSGTATIVRIQGNRVDVVLDQSGGDYYHHGDAKAGALCGQSVRAGIYHAHTTGGIWHKLSVI